MDRAICILACVVIAALYAWALARCADDDDWREDWCSTECMADEGQAGPCADCPRRRSA